MQQVRRGPWIGLVAVLVLALAAHRWLDEPGDGQPGPPARGAAEAPATATAPTPSRPDAEGQELVVPAPAVGPVAALRPAAGAATTGARGTTLLVRCSEPPGTTPALTLLARPLDVAGALPQQTTLSEAGTAELPLVPGRWQLALVTPLGEVALDEQTMAPGVTEVSCDLRTLPGLESRVVDESNRPLPGARVSVDIQHDLPLGRVVQRTAHRVTVSSSSGPRVDALFVEADAQGRVFLPALPTGELLQVQASAAGHLPTRRGDLLLAPGPATRLPALVLSRGRTVAGRVLDGAGLPIRDCPVSALIAGRPFHASSDDQGRFAFPALPLGAGMVWTEAQGLVNDGVRVPATGDQQLTLTLQAGGWLEGTVTLEDGSPVDGVLLMARVVSEGDQALGERLVGARSTRSARDGSYRLGPFGPGWVRLDEPRRSGLSEVLEVPGRRDVVVPSPASTEIRLRFLSAASGQPLTTPGRLDITWGSEQMRSGVSDLVVHPDEQGEVLVTRPIPPGARLWIGARFDGHQPLLDHEVPLPLPPGEPLSVTLEPQAMLVLEVSGPQGPLPGATIQLLIQATRDTQRRHPDWQIVAADESPFDGRAALACQLRTDDAGRARCKGLTDGPLIWRAKAPGFEPRTGQLETLPPPSSPDPEEAVDLHIDLLPAP